MCLGFRNIVLQKSGSTEHGTKEECFILYGFKVISLQIFSESYAFLPGAMYQPKGSSLKLNARVALASGSASYLVEIRDKCRSPMNQIAHPGLDRLIWGLWRPTATHRYPRYLDLRPPNV